MKKIFRFLQAEDKLLGALDLVLAGAAVAGALLLKKKKDETALKDVLISVPEEKEKDRADQQHKEE